MDETDFIDRASISFYNAIKSAGLRDDLWKFNQVKLKNSGTPNVYSVTYGGSPITDKTGMPITINPTDQSITKADIKEVKVKTLEEINRANTPWFLRGAQ